MKGSFAKYIDRFKPYVFAGVNNPHDPQVKHIDIDYLRIIIKYRPTISVNDQRGGGKESRQPVGNKNGGGERTYGGISEPGSLHEKWKERQKN